MYRFSVLLMGMALLFTTFGCETVESRIQKNESAFNSYPENIQQQIRNEQIDVGYTREMVMIALGRPDKVYMRTDKNGTNKEIWTYKGTYYNRRYLPHHDFDHRYNRHHGHHYQYELEEYDQMRLEFVEGKVAVIEQESQQ